MQELQRSEFMKKFTLSALTLAMLGSTAASAALTYEFDNGDSLSFDGRFEARFQDERGNADTKWNSGSSRFGLKGIKKLEDGWEGFGHAEWGYNSGSNGSDIYDRLLYAGLEHDTYGKIAVGPKQWSTFYDVAWVTDMGRTYGTRASGVYNLTDWGISSGTGRAANSVTYRNSLSDRLSYGFTYQSTRTGVSLTSNQNDLDDNNSAKNVQGTLKNGMGASANYKLTDNITFGLAYHQNEFADLDAGVKNVKNGDNQRLSLMALSYSTSDLFLGLTASQGQNWEINDTAEFYDSKGVEFFAGYFITDKIRPTFNFNYLSDRDDKANGYRRKTFTPGMEYHFVKNSLILWAEYQIDRGTDKWSRDAEKYQSRDNQLSAGLRYMF